MLRPLLVACTAKIGYDAPRGTWLMHEHNGAQPSPFDQLTSREREVLACIARGMSNAAIAKELIIGERTVKTHVSNILSKLQVQDRTQAAVLALREGLVPLNES